METTSTATPEQATRHARHTAARLILRAFTIIHSADVPAMLREAADLADHETFDPVRFPCADCGEDFLLTLDQRLWFRDQGLSLPKRCEACRGARKLERKAAR